MKYGKTKEGIEERKATTSARELKTKIYESK